MKYGVLVNNNTKNIGDDIQSYASSLFLPSIDYIVDRDNIDVFKSNNNEPVGVIMSAWWGWKKWNWPPASCIIPKLVGIHFMNWGIRNWGSPICDENLDGIGGEYLKSYSPVGCRDMHTLKLFKSHGIDSYFSGCITLTIPKMKITKSKNKYICVVDVDEKVIDKVKSITNGTNVEVKIMTHNLSEDNEKLTWEQRSKNVEKLLTIYQNAELVITSRLHATLPCIAMEVPVLWISDDPNCNRFEPYKNYCSFMTSKDFIDGGYDILNPKPNNKEYLKVREELIKSINSFINKTKDEVKPLDELIKINYSEEEKIKWQYDLMKETLEKWFWQSRDLLSEYNKTVSYCRELEKKLIEKDNEIQGYENSKTWKLTKPFRRVRKIIKK